MSADPDIVAPRRPSGPGDVTGHYDLTRARVEDYFDRTATSTWERLTSDAPVSGIRKTVREGRDRMRALILSRLPDDLTGLRVLDAGCGAGQMTIELARRGADVVAVDVAPALLEIARRRMPEDLPGTVRFQAGDMLDSALGDFDHVVAMDSLIYYNTYDICGALAGLAERTRGKIIFTVAPRTPALMAMWSIGKLFPKADRSPTMIPHNARRLASELRRAGCIRALHAVDTISTGFYKSACMEVDE